MSPRKTPEREAEEARVRAAIADLQAQAATASPSLSRYTPTSGAHTLSARIENSTYYALAATSQAEGVSVNSLLNDAVSYYLTSSTFKERREQTREQTAAERAAQERADEAIRKLSGG